MSLHPTINWSGRCGARDLSGVEPKGFLGLLVVGNCVDDSLAITLVVASGTLKFRVQRARKEGRPRSIHSRCLSQLLNVILLHAVESLPQLHAVVFGVS